MEVKVIGWPGVGDGQCKWNMQEEWDQEFVEQNVWQFYQHLYVS